METLRPTEPRRFRCSPLPRSCDLTESEDKKAEEGKRSQCRGFCFFRFVLCFVLGGCVLFCFFGVFWVFAVCFFRQNRFLSIFAAGFSAYNNLLTVGNNKTGRV